ncbi:MAG TPA: hypothetical protein ENH70_01750 [Desulfobacteraceae bacterium]|nr:hypothetical protein [Desulfobacteraceae bacterium]
MFELEESTRILFTIAGSAIAVATHFPYIIHTIRGETKPHAFSWLIWALLSAIAFAGQVVSSGGPGSWITGLMCIISASVFFLALIKGERNITRFDLCCLVFSLSAIFVWILTDVPLWSIVLVTIIDAVAFAPTFRKSYSRPDQETVVTYIGNIAKWTLSLLALDSRSLTTSLYPLSLVVSNSAFAVLIFVRRSLLSKRNRSWASHDLISIGYTLKILFWKPGCKSGTHGQETGIFPPLRSLRRPWLRSLRILALALSCSRAKMTPLREHPVPLPNNKYRFWTRVFGGKKE